MSSYPIRGTVIGLMLSVPLWAMVLFALHGNIANSALGFTAAIADANRTNSPG